MFHLLHPPTQLPALFANVCHGIIADRRHISSAFEMAFATTSPRSRRSVFFPIRGSWTRERERERFGNWKRVEFFGYQEGKYRKNTNTNRKRINWIGITGALDASSRIEIVSIVCKRIIYSSLDTLSLPILENCSTHDNTMYTLRRVIFVKIFSEESWIRSLALSTQTFLRKRNVFPPPPSERKSSRPGSRRKRKRRVVISLSLSTAACFIREGGVRGMEDKGEREREREWAHGK